MSNPTNPSEDQIEAAQKAKQDLERQMEEIQKQHEAAKARVDELEREAAAAAAAMDELPRLRDKAASEVPNFAVLEAAWLKAALADPDRFDAPDGEFVDAKAPTKVKLTIPEMKALDRLRNGSLKIETLAGVTVFVDDNLDVLPRLSDEQKKLIRWEQDGHLTIRPFEGAECVFDDRLVKARQQVLHPTPQPGASGSWGQPTVVAGPVPDPPPYDPNESGPYGPVAAQQHGQPAWTGGSNEPPDQPPRSSMDDMFDNTESKGFWRRTRAKTAKTIGPKR